MSFSTRVSVHVREQFLLIIGGIPASWKWEELKDFVKSITDRIRADVVWHPCFATKQMHQVGSVKVNGREDAERLYGFLENCVFENRPVLVHCFDITDESEAKLIACNCRALGLDHLSYDAALSVYMRDYYPPVSVPTEINASSSLLPPGPLHHNINSCGGSYQSLQPIQSPHQITYGYGQIPALPGSINIASPTDATYPIGWNGAPINTTYGYYEAESRGIHISQLNFAASQRDLEELIRKAAIPITVTMKRNSSGKSKGSAVVLFASYREAQRAVEMLDGFMFMKRRIRVKLDRDSTASPAPPSQALRTAKSPASTSTPIVVDGSNSRQDSFERYQHLE